ncbi:MAG: hypothetical protein NVS4B7_18200 [Ktedonobacteraceae bacterium]
MSIALTVVASACLFLIVDVMQVHSSDGTQFEVLSIIGKIVAILGAIYLAHDLLCWKNGPLYWLTHFISSGILGVATCAIPIILLELVNNSKAVAHQMILCAAILGAFSSMSFTITAVDQTPSPFSWKSFFIGLLSGFGCCSLLLCIIIVSNKHEKESWAQYLLASHLLLGYVVLATIGGIVIGLLSAFWPKIHLKLSGKNEIPIFAWKIALVGGAIVFLVCLVFLTFGLGPLVLPFAVFLALIIGGVMGFSRFLFEWANALPESFFAYFGLTLVLIGACIDLSDPILNLLGLK